MEICTDFPKDELDLPVPLLGFWLRLCDIIIFISPFSPLPTGLQPHCPLLLLQKTRWTPVSEATYLSLYLPYPPPPPPRISLIIPQNNKWPNVSSFDNQQSPRVGVSLGNLGTKIKCKMLPCVKMFLFCKYLGKFKCELLLKVLLLIQNTNSKGLPINDVFAP